MHNHQSLNNFIGNIECFSLGYLSALLLYISFQVNTIKVFHNEICCVIFIEKFIHTDDVGISVEVGNKLCFFKEFLCTCSEIFFSFTAIGRNLCLAGISVSQMVRKVFLDCNCFVFSRVIAKVGYTEATFTENSAHNISARKDCAFR